MVMIDGAKVRNRNPGGLILITAAVPYPSGYRFAIKKFVNSPSNAKLVTPYPSPKGEVLKFGLPVHARSGIKANI